ncbi:MAG TPA: TetR/AcrR family transcriptional regulator [Longimicrobiales bacterium]|nr:TetR/AcrR family transcriptional regulator [Longimicrobiales bacterium]
MVTKPTELPRWRRTPEERPRQILEAALAVFGEQGLAGARIDDIADRAGISKGTVYLYFPSKDDLFREVIRDTFADMLEQVITQEVTSDAIADLRAFCRNFFSFLRSPRFESVFRLIQSQINAFPELSREYASEVREPIRTHICEMLERGMDAGVITRGDNKIRARMLVALLWQHGIWCARREVNPDLESRSDNQVLEEVITFFMEAVRRVRE